MPCYHPGDNDPSPEQLLAAKMPAVLCGLVSKLGDTAILNTVDWSKAGVSKEDFQKWWDLHKEADTVKEEVVKNNQPIHYYSSRGKPLLYCRAPSDEPVLTLENYTKWYEMWLVMPDGTVQEVPVDLLSETMTIYSEALWIDHLFSPRLLYRVAQQMGYYVDERALEVSLGRWIMEGKTDVHSHTCMEPNDGPEVIEI